MTLVSKTTAIPETERERSCAIRTAPTREVLFILLLSFPKEDYPAATIILVYYFVSPSNFYDIFI